MGALVVSRPLDPVERTRAVSSGSAEIAVADCGLTPSDGDNPVAPPGSLLYGPGGGG